MARQKKNKKSKLYFALSALFLLALLASGIYYSHRQKLALLPKSVRIGLDVELTGELKAVGNSSKKAALLAVKDINSEGGLKIGSRYYPVELIIKDNQGSIALSESNVKDLVEKDRVIAIVGPNANKFADPSSDVANSLKIAFISPWSNDAATTIDLTTKEPKRYAFRTAFTDDVQMNALANFAINTLHAKKAAILYDKDQKVLTSQADLFKKAFEKNGGSVNTYASFSEKDSYFTSAFNSILNDPPDIIFLPAYYIQASNIIKQAHYVGIKTPFLGSDAWGNKEILTSCGMDCEEYYLSAHFSPNIPTNENKSFVSEFQAQYKTSPDDVAALTYDSFGLIFQSLFSAGKINTQALRDQLIQINNYQGVTGIISYNGQNGDPKKSVVILQIKNGKLNYSTSINP